MNRKPTPTPADADRRRRAEERLREQHPEAASNRTKADLQRLVHELQVHEIELEMQNGELQQARDELEAGRNKYSELYDFAPVGYLTLDRDGTIREANLASSSLLGIERSRLIKQRLGVFVSADGQSALQAFLARVFENKARESCELTLCQGGKLPVAVRIEAVVAEAGSECRAVLLDITERKRAEEELQAANADLAARSRKLSASNNELTRFNSYMVDRELRMIELKKEIDDLCRQAGLPPRYDY
jgi:PAS domain S-box-containing protein